MKAKTKIKPGIILFVAGILLLGLKIEVDTNISYGFVFGVEEGIKKGGITYVLEKIIGDSMYVDIFFNPLGYCLLLLGASHLDIPKDNKYKKIISISAFIGLFASIAGMIVPFCISQYKLIGPVLACNMTELLVLLVIMRSFMMLCKRQIDNYLYMEVGKDLSFAMELYGFAIVASYVILPFDALYFYFAGAAYILTLLISGGAVLYYGWKVLYYTKKLKLFCTDALMES